MPQIDKFAKTANLIQNKIKGLILPLEADKHFLKVKLILALIICTLFTESPKCSISVCSHPYGNIHIRPTFQINGK